MSHEFFLHCPICDESDDVLHSFNWGADKLRKAVESAELMRACVRAGWSVPEFDGFMDVGHFILAHMDHGLLAIRSEYGPSESFPDELVDPRGESGITPIVGTISSHRPPS